MSKQDFFDKLLQINIGEWQTTYSSHRYNYLIEDGAHWNLEIHYLNKISVVRIEGDDARPYNFKSLLELFGEIEDGEENMIE
jgi:hypothetical protein